MKELIKQILREHVTNRVTIEEIILPEGFLTEILSEGTATVNIPNKLTTDLEMKINSYNNVRNKKGHRRFCPEESIQPSEDGKLGCKMFFQLSLKDHWIQRIFRDLEPEYMDIDPTTNEPGKYSHKKIVRPHPFEGIDLLMKNFNLIVNYINNGKKNWPDKSGKTLLLRKGDYSEIIEVFNEDKKQYKINFITQIKGEFFFDTPELKRSQNIKDLI